MNAQVLDGTVAVLWGSATKELNWVHLDPKHGRQSVARASAGGFWVREIHPVPNIAGIAGQALWAWAQIKAGQDLADQATHRLAPPSMQVIEPIPAEVKA
jgi:hypothetical protein